MLHELAAGAVLLWGGVACGVAAVAWNGDAVASLAFAAALGCAGAGSLTGTASDSFAIAACVLATAGIARLVVRRTAPVTTLSWLDAAIGGSAAAALVLTLWGGAVVAVGGGGVVGTLALSRWRPGPSGVLGALAWWPSPADRSQPSPRRLRSPSPSGLTPDTPGRARSSVGSSSA